MQKNKLLLIWPPFLASNILPLGVPFLSAYLKQNGFSDVEVFDANIAYWKTMKLPWFLYKVLKWGLTTLRRRDPAPSPLSNMIRRKIFNVLENIETKGKKSVPWSLKAILSNFRQDTGWTEQKKVQSFLTPILAKEDLTHIGISINYPEQLYFALLVAGELKKKWADKIKIVFGGAQITKHIEYLIQAEDVYGLVDFFVVRDGEEPLLKLLTEPAEKGFSNIPNLYFKDLAQKNGYKYSGVRFCLYPEDYLLPDFSGFDMEVYQEMLPIIVSKGCPWGQCAFCSFSGIHDRKFYHSSVQKTIQMIKEFKEKFNASTFCFMDDALQPVFMRTLAEELIASGIKMDWICSTILNREFAQSEFCRLLKKSGLLEIGFGLESVSHRILKLMNKYHQNLNPEEIKSIISVIRSEGIAITVCVIFGFPTETIDEARQTFDFVIRNLDLFDKIRMQVFCLEDLTQVFFEPEKFGITEIHKEDKTHGRRLGYRFETSEGMTQDEAFHFTLQALKALKRAFKDKVGSQALQPKKT